MINTMNESALFPRQREKRKRSVDLSSDTDVALDAFRALVKKRGVSISRGTAIDAILNAVLSLSPDQAAYIHTSAIEGYTTVVKAVGEAQDMHKEGLSQTIEDAKKWECLAELFDILSDGHAKHE